MATDDTLAMFDRYKGFRPLLKEKVPSIYTCCSLCATWTKPCSEDARRRTACLKTFAAGTVHVSLGF